jgi:monovalent cation:H+ antiporter-2, CPA2 family
MHMVEFIQDLAVLMLVAGFVTVLFHRFKQPVVLGYIIAGVIIGPHTPPFGFIQNEVIVNTLAELGVVFLLFSLGLEFSFRKLLRVGMTALISALAEIILMIWVGFQIGKFFDWSTMDALFLGAILSVSSTTIIIKALDDLKLKRERFAQLIFGILIVEDILAIGMIALLSAVSTTGGIGIGAVSLTLGKLVIFMVVALTLGILIVPRVLNYVARFESDEMLLITVLGICFGFCLIVLKMNYSIALGAFLIGAVMAESRQIHAIERLIAPVRDMFSAIFFVAIGLLLDPKVLVAYAVPVTVITVCVIVGKLISCGTGAFIAGNDGRTSMRIGMGLSQIGEFSFIIASLGVALKVTSDFIYPITVAVSAVTTLFTPYLIRLADPLSLRVSDAIPMRVSRIFSYYTQWLQNIRRQESDFSIRKMIRRIVFQLLINAAIIAAIFLVSASFAESLFPMIGDRIVNAEVKRAALWGAVLIVSMPFFIASYRKIQALTIMLAEKAAGPGNDTSLSVVSEVIPIISIVIMLLLVLMLSAGFLPSLHLLIPVLCVAAVIVGVLWKRFIRIHSRLQTALKETLDNSHNKA